ncbi:sulfatase-like hydrolase/transferase [Neisseriaceae bacterium ESL0693]|nr:sulfatase-like hydrolase/transferase [Neisseriaceae bacterium ESL0693]
MQKLNKSPLVSLSFMLLTVLVVNAVMGLVSHYTGTTRAWLNLDYFLPLLLLLFRKKITTLLALVLFIIVSCIDFLELFKQLFPFMRLGDILYLSQFAWLSSHTYQLYALILVLALIAQVIFLGVFGRKLRLGAWLAVLNVVLLVMIVQIYVLPEKKQTHFWVPEQQNWVASSALDFWQYYHDGFISTYRASGDAFQPVLLKGASASDALFQPGAIDQQHKVLLIVNESWGMPHDQDIQDDVLASLLNSAHVSDIQQGSLPFVGYTIQGEMRELCQKALNHFNLKDQKTGFEQCLPNQFARKGFHTVAVHGALSVMYDRRYWYPRAGFQTTLFRDAGLNLPQSVCYSFPGNCDRDIAGRITQQFQQHDKLFLYWMTLNTHATYDLRDLHDQRFQCSRHSIDPASDACRNLRLQAQFFDDLAQMLTDPAFKGTQVIVVGDHEPPIIHADGQAVFQANTIATLKFKVQ